MAYTALTLINRAYNLSRIVSPGLQTVTGAQQSQGLFLLNALLEVKSADIRLIPYFRQYDGVFIIGQESYFITGLVGIESMTFNIGTVRYSMEYVDRKQYFGSGRVDNINSLPFNYHYERVLDGSNVYVYYLPAQAYPFKIWGKFALTDVVLTTDLTTVYDNFYIEYLRYALAEYICEDNGVNFAPQSMKRMQIIEKKLTDVSPPDLTLQKASTLNDNPGLSWADINIGRGWRPY